MTYRTPAETTAWLHERLRALGTSQRQLASDCGVDESNISKYRQHKHFPSARIAQQLAEALGTDIVTVLIEFGVIDPDGPGLPRIEVRDDGGSIEWPKA